MQFMARSAASLIAILALGSSARAADVQLDESQPIQLDARSSDFDYKSSTLVFKSVRISQGRLWIEADSATANGLNFDSSVWQFTGHVRVGLIDGTLESADARITFKSNQVDVADITGSPAMFEQKRPNGVAHGRASHIEYRPTLGTVRLTGDAWLSDGTNEISGATLVYDLVNQRVIANPDDQGDQRVRLTIQPKKTEKNSTPPEAKPKP
jgi:lipopolysaccharide transport protein LptA